MADIIVTQEKWQWQEPGTAWKGAALYHITLTVPDRRPVLGMIATTDGDPAEARVVRTAQIKRIITQRNEIRQERHTVFQFFCK